MLRPNEKQQLALIDFMELHPDLARARGLEKLDAKSKSKALWRSIATQLNAMGGCIKDMATWKKYWNDKKRNTRKHAQRHKNAAVKTLGGCDSVPDLTPIELRILSIVGEDDGEGLPIKVVPDPLLIPDKREEEEDILLEISKESEGSDHGEEVEMVADTHDSSEQPQAEYETEQDMDLRNMTCEKRPRSRIKATNLQKAKELFQEMEERRIEAEGRLATGVQDMAKYLLSQNAKLEKVADAQIEAAKAQSEAAKAQTEAAKAQTETAKLQADAARAATKAFEALAQAARYMFVRSMETSEVEK